ncbi:cytochrome c55X [Marinobacter persicus]|uniref:Cytochrome c55X n=2 Tax=Marinobacter persicus TaxID=930118 RepID=A0A1I3VW37_9GAMM|nr:cytochrome c55X [Marinobacter persicus]
MKARCESVGPLVGFVLAVWLTPAASMAELNVDEAELENFVIQDCGSCHGLTMRGGLGPPLRPEDLEQLPAEAIAAIIREGVDGTAMPPWKALLSDDEMLWIGRQLKSGALVADD